MKTPPPPPSSPSCRLRSTTSMCTYSLQPVIVCIHRYQVLHRREKYKNLPHFGGKEYLFELIRGRSQCRPSGMPTQRYSVLFVCCCLFVFCFAYRRLFWSNFRVSCFLCVHNNNKKHGSITGSRAPTHMHCFLTSLSAAQLLRRR